MEDFLRQVATDLRAGKRRRASVRTILREAGFSRRGTEVVKFVRQKLKKQGLKTVPDFGDTDLDAQVTFELIAGARVDKPAPTAVPTSDTAPELRVGGVALKSLSSFDKELSWRSGYRILFRDFPVYVEALKILQADARVTVTGKGQNKYREDRNAFAFFIAVDRKHLGRAIGAPEHEYVVGLVRSLGAQIPTDAEAPPVEVESQEQPALKDELAVHDLEARLATRLGEGISTLRDTFESSIEGLRSELRDKVEELRHDSIRKLASLQNNEDFGKLIEEEHERHAGILAGREDTIREHEEEIVRLSAQLEELEAELTQGLTSLDPVDAFSTMEGTVRLFATIIGRSPVEILPNAIESARRSSCRRRLEVLQLLLSLRELAETLYVRGEQPGPLKEWFQRRGYEYALKDSESTTTKYGRDREFLIEGQKVLFEEHVTLFPNSADCTQIYFSRDPSRRIVFVGYVGSHLRITSR